MGSSCAAAFDTDIVVARFSSGGGHLGSTGLGDTEIQTIHGITVGGNQRLIGVGRFDGEIDYGTGTITSAGSDAFLLSVGLI